MPLKSRADAVCMIFTHMSYNLSTRRRRLVNNENRRHEFDDKNRASC